MWSVIWKMHMVMKMHMVIRLIVYARTKREALARAREILENVLVGEDGHHPFDGYALFNENVPFYGKNRWGNLSPAVRLMTEEGIKLVDEAWEWQKSEFERNLKELKEIGDKENWDFEKLMGNWKFRFRCYSIGQYSGSFIWLYDNDGEGIRDIEHLKEALTKWGNKSEYEDLDVWVVPVDVHY